MQRMTFSFQQIDDIACRDSFTILKQLNNGFANFFGHEMVLYDAQNIALCTVIGDTVVHQAEGKSKIKGTN